MNEYEFELAKQKIQADIRKSEEKTKQRKYWRDGWKLAESAAGKWAIVLSGFVLSLLMLALVLKS